MHLLVQTCIQINNNKSKIKNHRFKITQRIFLNETKQKKTTMYFLIASYFIVSCLLSTHLIIDVITYYI